MLEWTTEAPRQHSQHFDMRERCSWPQCLGLRQRSCSRSAFRVSWNVKPSEREPAHGPSTSFTNALVFVATSAHYCSGFNHQTCRRGEMDWLGQFRGQTAAMSRRREWPTNSKAYELLEECGRGVSATVRAPLQHKLLQLSLLYDALLGNNLPAGSSCVRLNIRCGAPSSRRQGRRSQ